ncbi:MAG: M20/M25/M40 family metallo-hydrolase [Henriciella sp.]|nr:M20/M25/M40 family metallo-hydrolase [Henriciella sp.]
MKRIKWRVMISAGLALGLGACAGLPSMPYQPAHFHAETTLDMIQRLSSDEMAGRQTGTPENKAARYMIVAHMRALGLERIDGSFRQKFYFTPDVAEGEPAPTKPIRGYNLIGLLHGTDKTSHTLVVTAHYDHLGVIDGEIYSGADDNASGVAGMLAVAEYFTKNRPRNDVLFVAFDGEEMGHQGSKYFIDHPRVDKSKLTLNLNLDMISRGDNGILWVSGTSHNPGLKSLVEAVAAEAPVTVKMGFDVEGEGLEDWTLMSDHAAFFKVGIPHLYLRVEDHPDYHKPGDAFEKVDQDWFLKSVDTAVMMAVAAEARLAEIAAAE